MGLEVRLAEPVGTHVGVSLSRRKRRMPEDLLNATKVRPALKEVGRGRVTQSVRRDVLDAGAPGRTVDERSDLSLVDPLTADPEQEGRTGGRRGEAWTADLEPPGDGLGSGNPERDHALLGPLAHDPQET